MLTNILFNVPLRKKVRLIFSIIIVATVFGIAVGITSFARVQIGGSHYHRIEKNMLIADTVAKLRANLAFLHASLLTMVIDDDARHREKLREDINGLSERIDELFSIVEDQIEQSGQGAEIGESIATARRAWTGFSDTRERELIPAIAAGRTQEAIALARGIQAERYTLFSRETRKVVDHVREDVPLMVERMKRESNIVKGLFIAGGIIFIAFYFAVAWFFSRTLVSPIVMVSDRSQKMAAGDFAQRAMQPRGSDEIGSMILNFSSMAGKVADTAARLKMHILSLSSSSEQLSLTAGELSAGAERQSAQAREVTAAADQMSQTIALIAENAAQAAEAAKNASDAASGGKEIVTMTVERLSAISDSVKEASDTIDALSRSSEQIGEILNLIHAIADQTNLLALNAAIEAARAGEQGRGFAVVADEVRKLADRTSHATKDIEHKISGMQSEAQSSLTAIRKGRAEVDKGMGLARSASQSLDTIAGSSSDVMDMVQRIAAATEEQSATAEEITRNMKLITEVVESSSEATGQVREAAQALAQVALETENMMTWFKTENGRPKRSPAGLPA